jgi:dihydroflavonol-4-reductase
MGRLCDTIHNSFGLHCEETRLILVTGGTGFLGRNMLPILIEAGYPVRVITRRPDEHPWLSSLDVQVIQADVADANAMNQAAKGVRYIIHAAGLFRFLGKTQDFDDTNILGTKHLLDAALAASVEKVVHVSTIAVAGYPRDPQQIIDEDYPPQPHDDYQRTKLAGEHIVLQQVAAHHVPAVIIRGGAFYGPYGRYAFNKLFFEDPLIHHLPMGVDWGRHITFPAYIKDVARGILLGLEKGKPGEIYNISGKSISHREVETTIARISGTSAFRIPSPSSLMVPAAKILTLISKITGHEVLYVSNMRPYILGEWNVSIEKACRELDYQPTPFEIGVRETLEWYIESGLWKSKKALGH